MEKRRASSSRWCLLTALVFGCFCGDGTAEDIRIYNPSGWNLPETSDLQFVSREIISHPDIPVTLEVEKYESKSPEAPGMNISFLMPLSTKGK